MQTKNLDLLDLIERISEDVNSILGLMAGANQTKPAAHVKVKDSDSTELKSKMIQRLMFIQNEAKDEKTSAVLGGAIEALVNSLLLEIDESLEQRIKDIVKESLAEQPELTAPISMPVSVSDDGRGCVGGVGIGQAPLKPYEETQDTKLELISTLIALADTTDDHSTAIMLRLTVKRIFQRDFKIDFDSGAQEEKPHIPQPKSI